MDLHLILRDKMNLYHRDNVKNITGSVHCSCETCAVYLYSEASWLKSYCRAK